MTWEEIAVQVFMYHIHLFYVLVLVQNVLGLTLRKDRLHAWINLTQGSTLRSYAWITFAINLTHGSTSRNQLWARPVLADVRRSADGGLDVLVLLPARIQVMA